MALQYETDVTWFNTLVTLNAFSTYYELMQVLGVRV